MRVSGGARTKAGEDEIELALGRRPRHTGDGRGLQAGPEGAEVLVFGAPNTENRDAEPVPGWWTD